MNNKTTILTLCFLAICYTAICCNVNVTSSNGQITVSGLTSEENTKLFDADINAVWECNPWNGTACSGSESISGVTTGATYFLSIQSDVCSEWIPITVVAGGTTASCVDGIQNQDETGIDCGGSSCSPCQTSTECNVTATSSGNSVTISGLTSTENTKLFDADYNTVWNCNPWNGIPCGGTPTVSNLANGTYILNVISDICDEWITITIDGGGNELPDLEVSFTESISGLSGGVVYFSFDLINSSNTDAANTYEIQTYISTDTDLSNDDIPEGNIQTGFTGIGTTTVNGAITVPYNLADGDYFLIMKVDDDNTIAESNENNNTAYTQLTVGTEVAECNVAITSQNSSITINGLPSDANTKLFDASYAVAFQCNPWSGSPCQNEVTINNMIAESTYFLSVQSSECDEWIPVTIDGGGTDQGCQVELENYQGSGCFKSNEDGTFTTIGSDEQGLLFENTYESNGTLISSTEIDKTIFSISNNTIIETDSEDNILSTTMIDPTLVATYTTGNNYFLPEVVISDDGTFYVVGRVVDPAIPVPADNQPSYPAESIDDIFLYHLDANGNEIKKVLITTLSLTDADWGGSLSYHITVIGIIPRADNGIDMAIKMNTDFPPGAPTSKNSLYEIDPSFTAVSNTVLGFSNSYNTWTSTFIDKIQNCSDVKITNTVKSWNGKGNHYYTTLENWDYSTSPRQLIYIENTHRWDGIGAEETKTLTKNLPNGTTTTITNYFAWDGPQDPAPILVVKDTNGNIIYESDLEAMPEIFMLNGDGTYSYITGSTLYTTGCDPTLQPANSGLQKMNNHEEKNFSINNILPNPTDGEAFLKIESNTNQFVHMTIYDVTGRMKLIQTIELETGINTKSMNLENLPHGIYNLIIRDDGNTIETIRFMRN